MLDGAQLDAAYGTTPLNETIIGVRLTCPHTHVIVEFSLDPEAQAAFRKILDGPNSVPAIEIAQTIPGVF